MDDPTPEFRTSDRHPRDAREELLAWFRENVYFVRTIMVIWTVALLLGAAWFGWQISRALTKLFCTAC